MVARYDASAMTKPRRIAVIGAGTMGRALAQGLIQAGDARPEDLVGTTRHADRAAKAAEAVGIEVHTDNAAAVRGAELVLLCVKPKGAPVVLEELAEAGALAHDPLIISVAAGVRTATLEAACARGGAETARVVRAMPNTPSLVREGMCVVSGGRHASEEDVQRALAVFRPLGRVLRLDEEHMDAVTGLSASGPAFVYVIIESLAEGGVMMGLPRGVATELAAQAVLGAARMVLETGRHPAALKDEVTTPAGCTVSALLALEDGKLRSVLARGVETAGRAARGLG